MLPRPVIQWRVERLQAVGHRVLFAAPGKSGKTTIADNLARGLLDGDRFLGEFDVTRIDGALAILDFEMPAGVDVFRQRQSLTGGRGEPFALCAFAFRHSRFVSLT